MTGTHPKPTTPAIIHHGHPYGYPDAPKLTWQVAPVSNDEEHIELRHGSATFRKHAADSL